MKVSENLIWIFNDDAEWRLFTNKSAEVMIQKAVSDIIYNVPGKSGLVYNYLEQAFEEVSEPGYVVTGVSGEMWPIPVSAVSKYDINPEYINEVPVKVRTIETGDIFMGMRIPESEKFWLEVNYGKKSVLNGNADGIEHADGDYILIRAKYEGGRYCPDFNDSGKIINGKIFSCLYREIFLSD